MSNEDIASMLLMMNKKIDKLGRKIKRLEGICKALNPDNSRDPNVSLNLDWCCPVTDEAITYERTLNIIYEQMCWAFRSGYIEALKEDKDCIFTSEQLTDKINKDFGCAYEPSMIDAAFGKCQDSRLGRTKAHPDMILDDEDQESFRQCFGNNYVYHHPHRAFYYGWFSWIPYSFKHMVTIPDSFKYKVTLPDGLYIDENTLNSFLQTKKAGYEPSTFMSACAHISANLKGHDFIVHKDGTIHQYATKDVFYTRESAKQLIDEWKPKNKQDTRPKFVLEDLIITDYDVWDKIMDHYLDSSCAERWLVKEKGKEPEHWFVSYMTWRSDVEQEDEEETDK